MPRSSVYQLGRGSDPVTVVGSLMSFVARSIGKPSRDRALEKSRKARATGQRIAARGHTGGQPPTNVGNFTHTTAGLSVTMTAINKRAGRRSMKALIAFAAAAVLGATAPASAQEGVPHIQGAPFCAKPLPHHRPR